MNSNGVNVKVIEDDAVTRRLNEVANQLSKKYNKKRKVNEQFLKPKSPLKKFVSFALNSVSVIIFCICLIFCFSAVYNRIQNIPPSVAGYFCMRVSSGSMENSGFYKGDGVIVRSVNPKTLKEGDIIAFYSDNTYVEGFSYNLTKVPNDSIPKTEYALTFEKFFGIQPNKIKTVAKRNQMLVFHHIREVYQDANGKRFFKTYGSSNLKRDLKDGGEIIDENINFDSYLVQEDLVVGKYNNSKTAKLVASILNVVSTPLGALIVLSFPVLILMASLLLNSIKNVQLAFLENDVVEEKRKLTDDICVKNNIGYRMNTKTKYKVLAQAPEDKKLEYINLLWKTDNRPQNIRKYYLRKRIILRPMQKLRDVNRQCEQMFKDNVAPIKIAKFYEQEKSKIQAEEKRYNQLLKEIRQNNKTERKQKEEDANMPNLFLTQQKLKSAQLKEKTEPTQTKPKTTQTKTKKLANVPANTTTKKLKTTKTTKTAKPNTKTSKQVSKTQTKASKSKTKK